MTLPRPDASIVLNGTKLSAAQAGVTSLRLDLGFNGHDRLQLHAWLNSKLATAEPGQDLSLTLRSQADGGGLVDALASLTGASDVTWTGTVAGVGSSAGALVIDGLASTAVLSRTRRSATWTQQSVADVVTDLAGDLDTDIEADLALANFSIDNRRSVWAHLVDLARLSGAELSCAAGGGLRFVLAERASAPVELRFGADLIAWQLRRSSPPVAVEAAEHGAASSAGVDKWHWLAHDPVGTGDVVKVPRAAFHSREAAAQFTAATAARAARAAQGGSVWLGGRPDLRPGMVVSLIGLPEGDSGPLRIRAVTHALDGEMGFVTALAVEGASGGGGLSLPGGLL